MEKRDPARSGRLGESNTRVLSGHSGSRGEWDLPNMSSCGWSIQGLAGSPSDFLSPYPIPSPSPWTDGQRLGRGSSMHLTRKAWQGLPPYADLSSGTGPEHLPQGNFSGRLVTVMRQLTPRWAQPGKSGAGQGAWHAPALGSKRSQETYRPFPFPVAAKPERDLES